MMPVNFGLLDTTLPGRIAAIPQEAQKQQAANMLQAMQMQGAMREGQMSQMKIDEMLAERKEIDTFAANLKARGYTQGSKAFFTELASSRNPTRMQQGFEGLLRLEEQDKFDAYQQRQSAKRTNALAPSEPGAPVNAMLGAPTLADLQDEARALSMLKDPRAKDELAFVREQIKQRTQPRVVAPSGSVVVEGVPTYTAPAAVPPPRQPNLATDRLIPDGQGGFKPNQQLIDIETGLRQAGRTPAQPRPDRLLTPDEEAQKIRIALGSRPPPVETRPLTAQQQLKAKETQAAQRGVVNSADTAATELETLADNLLGNPDKKIQPNPGLGGITGYMGLVPSFPKTAARSAQQQLDTFKGKVMAFGRLLATQQGKLGNMAVSEWKFISDAIEKIDPLANNFDTQLRDVVRQAKDFAAAKRETFDELYDSTTPTGGANAPQTPVDLQSAARAEIARRAKDKR